MSSESVKSKITTVKNDVFAGIVSSFSVIPEVVGFCLLAGVSPTLGLYTSIVFLVLSAFIGGRPAMVSAGAGSMALVVMTLISGYGTDYLFCAVILAGVIQLVLQLLHVDKLVSYVPGSVMTGFVDALAIIILMTQFKTLIGETTLMLLFVAVAILIVYLFPKVTTKVPSTLVAIAAVTLLSVLTGGTTTSIGQLAHISGGLPTAALPVLLIDPETWSIVLPYSLSLAFVGIIETLLTQQVVDEMTESESSTSREVVSQGVSNVVCGFLGAMPGCAMIGQAMVNVQSGGRGRLSTLVAGLFLGIMVIVGGALLNYVPLAALVGVMITVAIGTFDWSETKKLISEGLKHKSCMVDLGATALTVAVVVTTDNLAIGVGVGMLAYYIGRIAVKTVRYRRNAIAAAEAAN